MGGGASGKGEGSGSNSSRINPDKQKRHLKDSKNYEAGKSYTTLSLNELQNLVDAKLPTAQKIAPNKYRADCGKLVGVYVDIKGNEYPTTNVIIVTSKTGSHIFPAKPSNKGGKK